MIAPRQYQEEAINSIWHYFASGKTGNPVIAHPTGTGKSVLPAIFMERILKVWPNQRFLLATHVSELIKQNSEVLRIHWPDAPLGIYSAGLKTKQAANSIVYCGIQSAAKHPSIFGHRDILFIDECHLVSDEESSQYLSFIATLRLINPAMKIIGMSATPFRMGMGYLTDGKIFTDIIHNLTDMDGFNKLLADGYMKPLTPRRTHTELDVSNVAIAKGEFVGSQLQVAVDVDKITYAGLKETVEAGYNRRSWLIFASGIEHSEHIASCLNSFGVDCAAVHSKQTDIYNTNAIKAFKSNGLRAISSYSKLTTGFNHPDIDLIADFRPTLSIPLHCLDAHTEILTKSGFKNIDSISKNDLAASVVLHNNGLVGQYVSIDNIIKRETHADEFFVSYDSLQMDWRVTNKHNMIITNRFGRKRELLTPFFQVSENIVSDDLVKLPVSAKNHSQDLPLTDSELRFIGLVMTDGSLAKDGSAIIYQSERYPDVLNEIRKCIRESGMKFREYIGKPRLLYFTMHRFQVAFGEPRKTDKHLRGWKHLASFLTKDFALPLMELSERQFDILIEAINWGDGTKQSPKLDYIRRSYLITTGNRTFAERLQQVAVLNGYKCNIKVTSKIILITLKKKEWLTIQKSKDDRAKITKEKFSKEIIWCIENKNGTIITRRNGKITIMGNCQKLGRGTRPSNSAKDCLVLDFSRNVPRLGPINDPIIPKKKNGSPGDVPVKICDECGTYNHTRVQFCTNCGHEFVFQNKLVAKAGTHEIIKTDIPIYETYEVSHATYSKRQKDGKPAYIRANYVCGIQSFGENVFPSGTGNVKTDAYVKHLFHQWWVQRASGNAPATADDVLPYVNGLRCPKRIRVWVNRKYPEIISTEY